MDALIQSILAGTADGDLDRVEAALRSRRQFLAQRLALSLQVGDAVKFSDQVRPQYLVGRVGTVKSVRYTGKRAMAEVTLDGPAVGRFGKTINSPVSLLVRANG